MPDFMLLMHGDSADGETSNNWNAYLAGLTAKGVLRGGSAIGDGVCLRRNLRVPGTTDHLVGFVKIEARDLDHARELVRGNPVYEAGGTVEIRTLPVTG